jgi:hypothetical protein
MLLLLKISIFITLISLILLHIASITASITLPVEGRAEGPIILGSLDDPYDTGRVFMAMYTYVIYGILAIFIV